MIVTISILAACIAGALLYVKRRSQQTQAEIARNSRETKQFHAVSVCPGLIACAKAREVSANRYLSEDAPRLPLVGCDEAACTCRFLHFTDRRAGDDRRIPFQRSISGDPKNERRQRPERRRGVNQDELIFS